AAAKLAEEAAARAAGEVKPAFDAAAAAARSSAAAAKSAAEAQQAAAEAASDGAAARAAAARANQADAQAHDDAVKARRAANQANSDAAIAGRAASAAEGEAAAARGAASRAESDAAAARGAADRAEADATAANAAAESAQRHADNAATAAKNAMNAAIEAGKAADRAEEAQRQREAEKRKQDAEAAGADEQQISVDDEDVLFMEGGPDAVKQYEDALNQAKHGIIDYILENGGQVLLDAIGVTDAKKCFGEGDVAACLWTVINVGSLLVLVAKLPAVGSAIAKIASGLTKFLEGSKAGRKILELAKKTIGDAKRVCVPKNSFTPDTPVLMADGSHRRIDQVVVGEEVTATDPVSGLTGPRRVSAIIVGEGEKHLVKVGVGVDGTHTGTVDATDHHPFWVDGEGRWVDAKDLKPGSRLRAADGGELPVTSVGFRTEVRKVYNLTVEGIHTYYVDAHGADVLVHNSDACEVGEEPKPKPSKEVPVSTASWENARNKALELMGDIDPATRVPYVGRMEKATSTYGKVCGFETRVNGELKRFRLDWDPVKGPHINVTVGKGGTGKKWAIAWPGTQAEFEAILRGNI
ncbi:polymorphic toxin-type HINT domain-containing protein, partial [Amycolatopsis samaneae]